MPLIHLANVEVVWGDDGNGEESKKKEAGCKLKYVQAEEGIYLMDH